MKFDVAESPTRRFRLVYRETDAHTRGVLAIGVRDEHAIHRLAVTPIAANERRDTEGGDAVGPSPSPDR